LRYVKNKIYSPNKLELSDYTEIIDLDKSVKAEQAILDLEEFFKLGMIFQKNLD
jgi:hypothetical protein